jgi:hypothetical protein
MISPLVLLFPLYSKIISKNRPRWFTMVYHLPTKPKIKSGWWLSHPSEKYEFVSWDDEIPKIYGKS